MVIVITVLALLTGYIVWDQLLSTTSSEVVVGTEEVEVLITFSDFGSWDTSVLQQEFVVYEYVTNPYQDAPVQVIALSARNREREIKDVLEMQAMAPKPTSDQIAQHQLYHIDVRNVPLVEQQFSLAQLVSADTPNVQKLFHQTDGELTAYVIGLQRELDSPYPYMVAPSQLTNELLPPAQPSRPSLFAARLYLYSYLINHLSGAEGLYTQSAVVEDILVREQMLANAFSSDIQAAKVVAQSYYAALRNSEAFLTDFRSAETEWGTVIAERVSELGD